MHPFMNIEGEDDAPEYPDPRPPASYRGVDDAVYRVGSMVPEDGWYACVPCGSRKYLKAGARFPGCLTCLGKERRFFRKGLELWERVSRGWRSRGNSVKRSTIIHH